MKHYDALVIGSGPAGICAALYLARSDLAVALIEQTGPGGLLLQTAVIENYPGFPQSIKGYELADAFAAQLEPYKNLTRITATVTEMDFSENNKRVRLGGDTWLETDAVVICSGVRYRQLGLDGERRMLGKGISYCALCDGNFFRGQNIAVVGGGNSALEEALYLARLASHVHVIHRRDEFRGIPMYVSKLKALPNVTFHLNTIITKLCGETQLEGLNLKKSHQEQETFLPVNGLFVFIGFIPSADCLPSTLERDVHGFIETDTEMRTSLPGVFAAGDIRSKMCRQVVTAVGDGATAANSVCTYLMERKHAL
jgi:thioredoxin reductase (NADPH)